MPEQMILSKDRILRDSGYRSKVFLFSIFVFAGLCVQLSPFLYWEHSVSKLLTNMAAMLVLSVPIGYFIGLRNVLRTLRNIRKIKSGDFQVEEDRVKRRRQTLGASSRDHDNYQMDMEIYSKRTKKTMWVTRTEYLQSQVGDLYYMIYITHKEKQRLYAAYPAKQFAPDGELRSKIQRGL